MATRELKEIDRGIEGIKCECGGYAEKVPTTDEERVKYGCGRSYSCCDVAYVCGLCQTRWVGAQAAPEMSY